MSFNKIIIVCFVSAIWFMGHSNAMSEQYGPIRECSSIIVEMVQAIDTGSPGWNEKIKDKLQQVRKTLKDTLGPLELSIKLNSSFHEKVVLRNILSIAKIMGFKLDFSLIKESDYFENLENLGWRRLRLEDILKQKLEILKTIFLKQRCFRRRSNSSISSFDGVFGGV